MGYQSFWFIDKRNQLNNLKRWFIYGILLFAFVGISAFFCVKSMYVNFDKCYVREGEITITVDESKKTSANGYIKGTITNKQETDVKGKYIKFSFYTKNEINIGNEYIEIGNIKSNETKTYQLDYRYSNVDVVIIEIANNKE